MIGTAEFSPDGVYRYKLTRHWGDGDRAVTWVLLNPSTATADVDDPTIRRCTGYSQRWGFDRLTIVNIFAIRSTDWHAVRDGLPVGGASGNASNGASALHHEPVGKPRNDRAILEAARDAEVVVAGWGSHGTERKRAAHVRFLLADFDVQCLKIVSEHEPGHPLYLRGDLMPITYRL